MVVCFIAGFVKFNCQTATNLMQATNVEFATAPAIKFTTCNMPAFIMYCICHLNFTAIFVLCLCQSGKGLKALWQNLVLALALCVLLPKTSGCLKAKGWTVPALYYFLFSSFFIPSSSSFISYTSKVNIRLKLGSVSVLNFLPSKSRMLK